MGILLSIWQFFVDNILTKPHFLIGLIVFIGYALLKKPWYEALAGFIKATVGYLILTVGSGGLTSNFRPIIVGLRERFNLSAMVIDPYFGQNAVQAAMEQAGKSFGDVMVLLLIAYVVNILLVRFSKYTKMRAVFTTGNVQIQQSATAFWLLFFCFPEMGRWEILIVMSILLGLYWAVGSNLTVDITQELSEGAGFAIAHQQMFATFANAKIAEKLRQRDERKGKQASRRLEDIELPGWLSMFNENMVATGILMTLFFGIILLLLGKPYLVEAEFMAATDNFFFYILETSLYFAVYLAILQLGVRTFVGELTESFNGISQTFLPNSVPGIDVAATFGFGGQNAVTIGFISGALGQFLAILLLILFDSPTIVVAGFIPLFFDNAVIGVFANNRGGAKYTFILPFINGIVQVVGSALIATWVGLAQYGGYLGMADWATVWPVFTVIMKFLGIIGIVVVALILIAIPQIQYRRNPEGYFLIVEDYDAYEEQFLTPNDEL
ncbi:PTS ascorbate transporter subunit IIC [Suicoccus acidiformans]|uniref:Ascorbate-specific PTS system EIIC component n=1 Tax=Suicoccus acidiformans TaxID=2036206 RepID=A0A347WIG3_9LACT|nr:PTS ascorbate transporter subunit IIC [Suicoccus acidiformans]AXY24870.1 PTS ascorbate transporter subunit IIC [Suicoccus acidiformans]